MNVEEKKIEWEKRKVLSCPDDENTNFIVKVEENGELSYLCEECNTYSSKEQLKVIEQTIGYTNAENLRRIYQNLTPSNIDEMTKIKEKEEKS